MEVVGATTGAAAINAYGYNRDAWMTDVLLNQTRSHQKQQILISQAGMFRDDIRQTIQSSVQRQNNYVVVLSLILNMMENFYICSVLPERTPAFLWIAFLVCTGSSMVYLMLAIAFTIWANYMAITCQNEMLMCMVRLPTGDVSDELQHAAEEESAEVFEKQGVGKVLRVPFLGRLRRRESGARRRYSSEGPPSAVGRGTAVQEATDAMQVQREAHMQRLKLKMAEWHVLGKYTIIFGYCGLSMLLHAFSYFSVAKIYANGESRSWSCWIMQYLITTLVCALTYAFGQYLKVNKYMRFVNVGLEFGGQVSMLLFVLADTSQPPCRRAVPELLRISCFLCHLTLNLLTLYYKHIASAPSKELARWQSGDSMDAAAEDSENDAGSLSSNGEAAAYLPGDDAGLARRRDMRRRRLSMLGSGIVTIAWILSTVWVLRHTLKESRMDPGGQHLLTVGPSRPSRRLQESAASSGLDGAVSPADVFAMRESVVRLQGKLASARTRRASLERSVARLEAAFTQGHGASGEVLLAGAIDSLVHRMDAGSAGRSPDAQ